VSDVLASSWRPDLHHAETSAADLLGSPSSMSDGSLMRSCPSGDDTWLPVADQFNSPRSGLTSATVASGSEPDRSFRDLIVSRGTLRPAARLSSRASPEASSAGSTSTDSGVCIREVARRVATPHEYQSRRVSSACGRTGADLGVARRRVRRSERRARPPREAGIGKTALLEGAAATPGFRVLRARDSDEAEIATPGCTICSARSWMLVGNYRDHRKMRSPPR
jgi:hypothetical protein